MNFGWSSNPLQGSVKHPCTLSQLGAMASLHIYMSLASGRKPENLEEPNPCELVENLRNFSTELRIVPGTGRVLPTAIPTITMEIISVQKFAFF